MLTSHLKVPTYTGEMLTPDGYCFNTAPEPPSPPDHWMGRFEPRKPPDTTLIKLFTIWNLHAQMLPERNIY